MEYVLPLFLGNSNQNSSKTKEKNINFISITNITYMKKILKINCVIFLLTLGLSTSSCYVYEFNVGQGAQTGVEIKKKNHYLIYGLAPLKTSDPVEMANGADSYTVKVYHSFIDGLLNSLTFGIYNPTTTIVTK